MYDLEIIFQKFYYIYNIIILETYDKAINLFTTRGGPKRCG